MKTINIIKKNVTTQSGQPLYEMADQERIDLRDFVAGLILTCDELGLQDPKLDQIYLTTHGMPKGSSVDRQGGNQKQTRKDLLFGMVHKLTNAYDMSQRQLDMLKRTVNPLIDRLNQQHNYAVPRFDYNIITASGQRTMSSLPKTNWQDLFKSIKKKK
jgi:hypothetical protein